MFATYLLGRRLMAATVQKMLWIANSVTRGRSLVIQYESCAAPGTESRPAISNPTVEMITAAARGSQRVIMESRNAKRTRRSFLRSLQPKLQCYVWSGKRDSNSRPRPWQGRALPTELFPRLGVAHFIESRSPVNPLIQKSFISFPHRSSGVARRRADIGPWTTRSDRRRSSVKRSRAAPRR